MCFFFVFQYSKLFGTHKTSEVSIYKYLYIIKAILRPPCWKYGGESFMQKDRESKNRVYVFFCFMICWAVQYSCDLNFVVFACHNLNIDNEVIERIGKNCPEESFKFVGINLDESLSSRHHVNYVRNKIAGATYALSKLKNLLPSKIKLTVYNSLFNSHFELE